jgi:type IV pilus assembly protein PilM
MAGNTVSLYINDVSIRLMVTRGKRITKLAEAPLDTSLGEIDIKEKETELANKIKGLLKSNKINARKIILGLSGLHCFTRPLVLPELPRTMLNEAITRESRRVLPMPLDQLYLSWQIVSTSAGKIQAYVVALPREIADMVIRVVNQAGCKPYLMDIKPLALARLSREANALIIDVQAKELDIINMVNGIPQPIRTVAFPQEKLSLLEKFEIVKDDVKRTIQFYNNNNAENPIKPNTTMLVSGELSAAPELYESLANELGFKASLLTSPLKCLKHLDASHYLVNVGLALKELNKEAGPLLPNFNVLPAPYQPKHVSMNQLLAVPAVAIAIALIVMMIITVQNTAADIDSLNTQVVSNNFILEKKQAQKKVLIKNISDLQAKITVTDSQYSAYSDAYIKMNRTGDIMNTDLKTTVANVVDELFLVSLVHSSGQISIEGTTFSEQSVLEYVRNLAATGRFDEITIANITRNESGEEGGEETVTYTFSLRCYLKDSRP